MANTGMKGCLIVEDGEITITRIDDFGQTCSAGIPATIEGINESARILAAWLDLPSENLRTEVQRIHRNETMLAFLRDVITLRKERTCSKTRPTNWHGWQTS